jgi:hypothetical protein
LRDFHLVKPESAVRPVRDSRFSGRVDVLTQFSLSLPDRLSDKAYK